MILVVGGAGYIGSHFVKELVNQYEVIVLDNLSTGHRWAVDSQAIFVKGNLGDINTISQIFNEYNIEAVVHFAASSLVQESIEAPIKYYENNVISTLSLLKIMRDFGINKFIFSSTAAVYGIPNVDSIDETIPLNPINPYGRSKWMVEQILSDFAQSYDMKYVTLRYFNAAGAHEKSEIGEDHQPETHLIPIVLEHLLGHRESISVFGTDYETVDGTCIRDYVHVIDLAKAHMLALKALLEGKLQTATYNLGNGNGYSVNEIIKTCERITGLKANVKYVERRPGDPAKLIANSDKIYRDLGWKALYDINSIIDSAWKWHKLKELKSSI